MRWRRWPVILWCALCGSLLFGCEYRVVRDPSILVRALPNDPATLNPITARDGYEQIVNGYVMERLLEMDVDTYELIPGLAERWEVSPDHLTYTFYLRRGVRWHDGQPFTADDVIYSFERINDPAVGAAHLMSYFVKSGITRAEKLDDHTVRFFLERPYFFALETLGGILAIVPQHVFATGGDFRKHPAGRHPIGTGPMRFVEWKTGRHITLTRNDDYWGKAMPFRGIHFAIISDEGVAFQALKKAQIDYAGIRPTQWAKQSDSARFAERFRKFKYYGFSFGYGYVGWNIRHPILQDKHVRQALTMLIPRDDLVKYFLYDVADVADGPFHPYSGQHDPSIAPWPYDHLLAKQLLKTRGWEDHDGDGWLDKDGQIFRLSLLYPGGAQIWNATANIMRENFRKAGIELAVRSMEWSVFQETIQDKQFDLYFAAWGVPYEGDPYQLWHSSQIEGGSNYINYANAEVDQIIEQGRAEFDPVKRNALYQRMHRILHEEQPYTFLYRSPSLVTVHHRFTDVRLHRAGLDEREWGIGPSEPLVQ